MEFKIWRSRSRSTCIAITVTITINIHCKQRSRSLNQPWTVRFFISKCAQNFYVLGCVCFFWHPSSSSSRVGGARLRSSHHHHRSGSIIIIIIMTRWSLRDSFVRTCVFQGHHHQEASDSTSLPMCASSIRWRLLLWKLTFVQKQNTL